MTKINKRPDRESERCRWCRRILTAKSGPGRPREFCSQVCRQWDWVAKQRSKELALTENELVIARDELDGLKDMIYVLCCAVEDVRSDIDSASRATRETLQDDLRWLIESAEPVIASDLRPRPT